MTASGAKLTFQHRCGRRIALNGATINDSVLRIPALGLGSGYRRFDVVRRNRVNILLRKFRVAWLHIVVIVKAHGLRVWYSLPVLILSHRRYVAPSRRDFQQPSRN